MKSYTIAATSGFPFEMTTTNVPGSGDTVVPISLENNVSMLYAFFFNAEAYVPSETVQFKSDYIIEVTGIDADASAINTDNYNDTAGQAGTVFD